MDSAEAQLCVANVREEVCVILNKFPAVRHNQTKLLWMYGLALNHPPPLLVHGSPDIGRVTEAAYHQTTRKPARPPRFPRTLNC